ncbi:MAG TPA: tetratricopeptide repeat protein [Bacteroidia bacterium]|nr:tetratricopeptide repeat protein [Bacteroidia bacterium]
MSFNKNIGWVLLLLLVAAVVYYPVLFYGYFPWDDFAYVRDNPDIKSISFANIELFFSKFYLGNYHPLTMLSFALDYKWGRGDVFYFHLTNVLLHTANALLVFTLLAKFNINKLVCVLTALLFLVSPIQFESVIWIAERKNVLFTCFYLLSVLFFVKYIERKTLMNYTLALLFFAFSLLSKAQAVTLPLTLLVGLYFYFDAKELKQRIKTLIPFFVLSLVFGVLAVYAEQSHGYVHKQSASVLTASYAFVQYVIHIVLPFKLSVFYSYPMANGLFEIISVIIVLFLIGLFIYVLKKQHKIIAALLFLFVSNIILILQFIPVGEAYMVDRYCYIPSIVVYFTLVYTCFLLAKKHAWVKFIPVIYFLLILYTAIQNVQVWKSNKTLFTTSLANQPKADLLMNVLGSEYLAENNFTKADSLFDAALSVDAINYQVLYNKATSLAMQKQNDKAIICFDKTIAAAPTYFPAYLQKAILLINNKDFKGALAVLDKTISIKPDIGKAYFLRALCSENSGDFETAINNYTDAVKYHYEDEQLYLNRAICYGKTNNFKAALSDVNLVLSKNPTNAFAWYLSGVAKINLKENGCNDLATAYQRGYQPAVQALNQYCR